MSALDIKQLVATIVKIVESSGLALDVDETALANFLTTIVPQTCLPPAPVASCSTAPLAAPQTDSDSYSMEYSDSASVSSSSRKRSAQSSIDSSNSCSSGSSDSIESVLDATPFTEVKYKRGSKRAAKLRPPPAVASALAAPAAAAPPLMSLDIPPPSEPAPRCASTKKQVPPPVFLRDKAQFTKLSKTCYDAGIKYDQAINLSEAIKITPSSIDDFRRLTRLFTNERVAYHTYALPEERKIRAVLRGVPFELSNEDILEDLKSQGFPVEAVHKMHNNKGKRFPLALLILTNIPEAKNIFRQVRTVCGLSRVKIEPPHRRGYPAQCHRCQLYGHAAANCSASPRCVKCLDPHSSKECPRSRNTESPPACVNCGQSGHPANYRGCPRAPRAHSAKAFNPAPPPVNGRSFPTLPSKLPRQDLSQPPPPQVNTWGPKQAIPTRNNTAPQQAQSSLADDLKTVYSAIRNVDIGEIAVLARKLRAAQSPQDRLLALAEHNNLLCSL